MTPYCLLDLGGGSVNELSYQQARNNRAAVGQVYVAESGGGVGLGVWTRRRKHYLQCCTTNLCMAAA